MLKLSWNDVSVPSALIARVAMPPACAWITRVPWGLTRIALPPPAAASAVLNVTSSLAFQEPALLAGGYLVDWIVSARLFTLYLNQSCVPGTDDHALLAGVVAAAPWPTPVRVYGYNGMDVVFAGQYGTGPFGDVVRQALEESGVTVVQPGLPDGDSGYCVALVDATTERTFVTSVGAEGQLTRADLDRVTRLLPGQRRLDGHVPAARPDVGTHQPRPAPVEGVRKGPFLYKIR